MVEGEEEVGDAGDEAAVAAADGIHAYSDHTAYRIHADGDGNVDAYHHTYGSREELDDDDRDPCQDAVPGEEAAAQHDDAWEEGEEVCDRVVQRRYRCKGQGLETRQQQSQAVFSSLISLLRRGKSV